MEKRLTLTVVGLRNCFDYYEKITSTMSELSLSNDEEVLTTLPREWDLTQQIEDLLQDSPKARDKLAKMESKLETTGNILKKLVKLSKQFQEAGNAFRDVSLQFGNELLNFNFGNLCCKDPLSFQVNQFFNILLDIFIICFPCWKLGIS